METVPRKLAGQNWLEELAGKLTRKLDRGNRQPSRPDELAGRQLARELRGENLAGKPPKKLPGQDWLNGNWQPRTGQRKPGGRGPASWLPA
jgi:hypothetical protein